MAVAVYYSSCFLDTDFLPLKFEEVNILFLRQSKGVSSNKNASRVSVVFVSPSYFFPVRLGGIRQQPCGGGQWTYGSRE